MVTRFIPTEVIIMKSNIYGRIMKRKRQNAWLSVKKKNPEYKLQIGVSKIKQTPKCKGSVLTGDGKRGTETRR